MKDTIGALLADLLEASLNVDSAGYCYRASDKDKINDTRATSRHYEKLKRDWSDMGFMDVVNGFQGTDDFDGEIYRPTSLHKRPATRLKATPIMLKRLSDYGLTPQSVSQHFRSDQKQTEPVVLKAANIKGVSQGKVLTNYEKSPLYKAIEADVIEIKTFCVIGNTVLECLLCFTACTMKEPRKVTNGISAEGFTVRVRRTLTGNQMIGKAFRSVAIRNHFN